MAKTRMFQVISNRIRFICGECRTKRSLPIRPNIRRKNIRCYKCGAVTKSQLNRRLQPRQQQSGKAIMVTKNGEELEINLHDISQGGLGFDIAFTAVRKISLKQAVQFKCNWNPRLLDQGRFLVKNIKGQRIGVQNIEIKRGW